MSEPFLFSHLENYDYPWDEVAKLPVCTICKGYISSACTIDRITFNGYVTRARPCYRRIRCVA